MTRQLTGKVNPRPSHQTLTVSAQARSLPRVVNTLRLHNTMRHDFTVQESQHKEEVGSVRLRIRTIFSSRPQSDPAT